MNYSKIITWLLLIGIIVFVLIAPKYCSAGKTKTDTFETVVHDTIWNIKKEKSPVYIPGKTQYLPGNIIYIPVDTNAILTDYYAKRIYHDTIFIDSFGFVAIHDTISKNRIAARQNEKDYKIPVLTKTITREIHHYDIYRKVYGGFLVDIAALGGQGIITYETKKNRSFHVGIGVTLNGGPSFVGGMSVPIWKSK